MTFLIDAQLPPALIHWLLEQGQSAQHVEDLGLSGAEDLDIWNRALQDGAISAARDKRCLSTIELNTTSPFLNPETCF